MSKWLSLYTALVLLFSAFSILPASADAPPLPEGMLPTIEVPLTKNQRYAVYQGPGENYGQAANGKAVVSTNDWVRIFGHDLDWVLIQYGISDGRTRFGYIRFHELADNVGHTPYLTNSWEYGRAKATQPIVLTDDPFLSQTAVETYPAGTVFITLHDTGEWYYVETESEPKLRGFVPSSALEKQPIPYQQDADLMQAVELLADTGIAFTVRGLYENINQHLYFSLANGGTLYYLDVFDFYRYDLRSWYDTGLSDEDMAKFIDYFLNIAADVEAGRAPDEHLQYGYHDTLGEKNIAAVVSNILSDIEGYGDQGLRILLDKLAAHDGNDALNSLRARAASRMLGRLDKTPVDPAQGCAWYDALTLSVQDDLPPVNAAVYVSDPVLAQVTQAMLQYNAENNPWNSTQDVDADKTQNIVLLQVEKQKQTKNTLTLWAVEWYSKYALYDGVEAANVSGHISPVRITMTKDASGNWSLDTVTYAQDGTLYAPSILDFCDGDRNLANALMALPGEGTWESFAKYLAANGYYNVTSLD